MQQQVFSGGLMKWVLCFFKVWMFSLVLVCCLSQRRRWFNNFESFFDPRIVGVLIEVRALNAYLLVR